jgi:hypothetical protein
MKNRDKDEGYNWIFKTYFKLFFRQQYLKMNELCRLHIFKVQTPQYGAAYPQNRRIQA